MEFTPFVYYLIYIILISIPLEIFHIRNRILYGKHNIVFYIIPIIIIIGLEGYMSYLIYKKQEDDIKHAWMLVGGLIGIRMSGIYLSYIDFWRK